MLQKILQAAEPFPMLIVGVMLLMTSLELGRVTLKPVDREGLIQMLFVQMGLWRTRCFTLVEIVE